VFCSYLPKTQSLYGCVKALLESKWHFDVIDSQMDFSPYKAIVLPENEAISTETARQLSQYVKSGGCLLATRPLAGEAKKPREVDERSPLFETLGIRYRGLSPYADQYIRLVDEELRRAVPIDDVSVREDPMMQAVALQATETLAGIAEPFSRNPLRRTTDPAGETSEFAGITLRSLGAGKAIYVAAGLFRVYFRTGNWMHRRILDVLLKKLIAPEQRLLSVEASSLVETSLMSLNGSWIVHLINFEASKRSDPAREIIEELPPRHNLRVQVRPPYAVKRVWLPLEKTALDWDLQDGAVTFVLPCLLDHVIVALERA
jgi:hypothetical protein